MKKNHLFIFLIPLLLLFTSCSSKKDLIGKWETEELYYNGQLQQLCISNITFIYDQKFMAKGFAGVNLFNASIKVKGRSFHASDMINTGFYGTAAAMDFENLFFDVLMHSDSYRIEGNFLYLYNKNNSNEIKFIKRESD